MVGACKEIHSTTIVTITRSKVFVPLIVSNPQTTNELTSSVFVGNTDLHNIPISIRLNWRGPTDSAPMSTIGHSGKRLIVCGVATQSWRLYS